MKSVIKSAIIQIDLRMLGSAEIRVETLDHGSASGGRQPVKIHIGNHDGPQIGQVIRRVRIPHTRLEILQT